MSTHDEPLLVKKRGRGDPYYLPSGNPSKGITQEISMNKQTGEELKHSNEVSEIILDSMSDAVSLINTDDYSIIDANKAFWGQYGLSKKDILGKPCYLVEPEELVFMGSTCFLSVFV